VGFLVALLAQLGALLTVTFVMPETLPLSELAAEEEESSKHQHANDAGTFAREAGAGAGAEQEEAAAGAHHLCTASAKYNPVSLMRILASTKATRRLSVAWFFRGMVVAGCESVYLAYTDSMFGWGPTEQVSEWSCREAAGGVPESAREPSPVYPAGRVGTSADPNVPPGVSRATG
jgi:hypothetical protein